MDGVKSLHSPLIAASTGLPQGGAPRFPRFSHLHCIRFRVQVQFYKSDALPAELCGHWRRGDILGKSAAYRNRAPWGPAPLIGTGQREVAPPRHLPQPLRPHPSHHVAGDREGRIHAGCGARGRPVGTEGLVAGGAAPMSDTGEGFEEPPRRRPQVDLDVVVRGRPKRPHARRDVVGMKHPQFPHGGLFLQEDAE